MPTTRFNAFTDWEKYLKQVSKNKKYKARRNTSEKRKIAFQKKNNDMKTDSKIINK